MALCAALVGHKVKRFRVHVRLNVMLIYVHRFFDHFHELCMLTMGNKENVSTVLWVFNVFALGLDA